MTLVEYDLYYKIIICGDSTVGKTSYVQLYSTDRMDNVVSTIGVDYISTGIKIKDEDKIKNIKLKIWDTAGQERFRSIIHRFYKDTNGALIMFDLTSRITFESLDYWYNELVNYITPDTPIVLIGNKCKDKNRTIIINEVNTWIENKNISYVEIDNLSRYNLDLPMQTITEKIYKKWKDENKNKKVPSWGIYNKKLQIIKSDPNVKQCCSIS
tara:strand:- start:985 stop:1620 length:636 start_codon:yes stop_codon:yes gene_type:complete